MSNIWLNFVLLTIQFFVTSSISIDWCEYWARMGKQADRAECAGYVLPPDPKRSDTGVSCPKNEFYNCIDCEPTCHNLVPKCRKEQCNRGCVCKNGLARSQAGKCIPFRECLNHHPTQNESPKEDDEGTVMKTVKKMVPVIVNDVWKAFFNSIRVPEEKEQIKPELKPVEEGPTSPLPPPSEINKEYFRIHNLD